MAHRMDDYDKAEILDLYDLYTTGPRAVAPALAYFKISEDVHREQETVRKFIRSMRDTTTMATRTIRARSSSMVEKVLRKADPALLVDILQRPNIGVLKPVVREPVNQLGIFVSVGRDSLGASANGNSADPLHYVDAETVKEESRLIEGQVNDGEIDNGAAEQFTQLGIRGAGEVVSDSGQVTRSSGAEGAKVLVGPGGNRGKSQASVPRSRRKQGRHGSLVVSCLPQEVE